MNDVLAMIRGKEQMPAESVFKNIQIFKGRPAGQVPRAMNFGFGRSLGVSCDHCHTVGQWDKDDKTPKQVAREMFAMVSRINTELLAQIKNLRGPNPSITCTTCHRGDTRPATSLIAPSP